ncbi:hypothetical protein M9Y10_026694 [Tritrichomonas musculus]|uniref:Myb-like DNA-binding domain containing protein n=1 Tax=Tritrichomonas musculus TaxID=1915356 RepID=A0ABR2H689_9EUKA
MKAKRSKRFPFTEHENYIIKHFVKMYGEDWDRISRNLPGRTPKQIHDRYVNYLRDGLINAPWSAQEDEVLMRMYDVIGPKWSKMMVNLPGRSGNDIKNRWHKHLYKNYTKNASNDDNSSTMGFEDFFDESISFQNSDEPKLITENIVNDAQYNGKSGECLNDKSGIAHNNQTNLNYGVSFSSDDLKSQKNLGNQLKMQNKDIGNNILSEEKINSTKNSQNAKKSQNQNLNSIRLVNKFDVYGNSILKNENNSSECNNSNNPIFKSELELHDIIEEINYPKIDFPWI